MKKKLVCLFLTVLMVATTITGCQSGKSTDSTGASGGTSGGETMTVMCVGTAADAYKETYQAIADEFSADNEHGVTVKLEFYENEQFKTKLTTLMASNSGDFIGEFLPDDVLDRTKEKVVVNGIVS